LSNHILETTYRGAHLKLEISEGKTRLLINGLVRDEGSSEKTLRLSSVVQTDYEWHELIEGFVSFEPGSITGSLLANNINVAQKTYKLGEE
jgi:hypothetical protein